MLSRGAITLLGAAALGLGCEKVSTEEASVIADEQPAEPGILGVAADSFQCDSVAPIERIASIVGAGVEPQDAPFDPPAGVPRPCSYTTGGAEPVVYSFDLDCRPDALDVGAKLMARYASAPEATPVRIGRSGLDHSRASLLFIDDDAPCYGRVLGPEAEVRLAIGELVSERLTEVNAPSGYRYRQTP